MRVAIIGAGLAGLTCAASLVEGGVDVVLLEQSSAPGGTTVLSSGWLWRYHDVASFRRYAPGGDPALQQAIVDGFDDAVAWLEGAGVRLLDRATANPRTSGVRVDPRQCVDALARALPAGVLRTGSHVRAVRRADAEFEGPRWLVDVDTEAADVSDLTTLEVDAVVFAGGGAGGDLDRVAREAAVPPEAASTWIARSAGTSTGSTLDAAAAVGARRTPATGEVYARAMPLGATIAPADFVRASQVYGAHARALDRAGAPARRGDDDWSDTRLTWQLGQRGAGWYLLDEAALRRPTPYGTVADAVEQARELGGLVLEKSSSAGGMVSAIEQQVGGDLGADARALVEASRVAVAIVAGITHTLDGLAATPDGALVPADGAVPVLGLFGAGVDLGGVATGGYASGLAQALVFGRAAAFAICRM